MLCRKTTVVSDGFFDWNMIYQVLQLYILTRHVLNVRDQSWWCTCLDAKLTFIPGIFLKDYP